jgi:hypothetical protein
MLEYQVINAHDFVGRPDEKRAQEACDKAAKDGWRLISATASAQSGGGRLLLFFERETPAK